ncbi:MAG: carbamoyltransferase HypF [Acidobacteriia bacterium]|nr:carbamoyltransferase HypF [Terriglobia bacterium]
MRIRKEIQVSGIVQGVGFRPYVFRLATDRHLSGSIRNTSAGVTIEIQGPANEVEDFLAQLPAEAPALARITQVTTREIPCIGDAEFRIVSSIMGETVRALISPDVAICDDCLRELFDPADRRYLYPFINCTNCGPRFTIIQSIPYDRSRTSMAVFPMCEECRREYEDPKNRRFHTQPNACWKCGPQLELWDTGGRRVACSDPVTKAVMRLRIGDVIAIKGLGGFHLAVDATNSSGVELLRRRKGRAEKPFAVMVPDLEAARTFCEIDGAGKEALISQYRPIVLLPRRSGTTITDAVAPFQRDIGIFLPYTPAHYLLFAAGNFSALVMTSANLSEEPISIDNREAVTRLAGIADGFLVHNRQILLRCDDSVVKPMAGRVRQFRRSRGYVPGPVELHKDVPTILAVGAELKNTICLTRGRSAFLSQHIGDLENLESFEFFREAVEHLQTILEIHPQIIAHDLHPDYLSTKWALAQTGVRLAGVQHHHAHIASCMAENGLEGRVIGFALDGTGYGADSTVWGGEALIAGYSRFERAGHIEYLPLPGGAKAIREPWRMGISYLAHTFGQEALGLGITFIHKVARGKFEMILRMMKQQVNSPLTSSCGRLFDGVAAVIGIREDVSYEAQAAMEMEAAALAAPASAGAYPFSLVREDGSWQIGVRPLFEAIIEDLRRKTTVEVISARFHNGLVEILARLAEHLREESSLGRVCLSGGTFQNGYLLSNLIRRLEEREFEVFTHAKVPAGDGGLCLGQALIAAHAAGN